MARQTMNCGSCGKQVEIIPAGVSKKNGKPYDSFYVCGHCNFSGNPAHVAAPAKPSANTLKLEAMDEKLDAILQMVEAIYKRPTN